MPYHSSLAIANEFLKRARVEQRELTHMHLQKLVYLAQGWTIAVTGRPLIEDNFEAWDYGPVIRRLYEALRSYGSGTVGRLIRNGDDSIFSLSQSHHGTEAFATLGPHEAAVIGRVWDQYKEFHAFQLSALTHADGSPWHRTYAAGTGRSRVINNDLIGDHFAEVASRND